MAFVRVPLARIQAVKAAYGVKVNDVILAMAASAFRRYLMSIDDLPSQPLDTSCPVALRADAEKGEIGNQVGMMAVPLATDIEDPVERLRAIYANTQAAKAVRRALAAHPTPGVVDLVPPGLVTMDEPVSGHAKRHRTDADDQHVGLQRAGDPLRRCTCAGPASTPSCRPAPC